MGWQTELGLDHEGFLVGFVRGEGLSLRELQSPADREKRDDIVLLSAGCTCGWRSTRWTPKPGARWHPFIVVVSKADDARPDDDRGFLAFLAHVSATRIEIETNRREEWMRDHLRRENP